MEEEEEETSLEPQINNLRKTSSTVTLIQQDVSRTTSTSTLMAESLTEAEQIVTLSAGLTQTQCAFLQSTSATAMITESTPQCQIVTQQASGDSIESESESVSFRASPRYSRLTTPHSSSSQEDYDSGNRTETARSMESLKTVSTKSFLSTSERDMRRVFSESTEAKSLETIDREIILKRHAVSGEGSALSLSSSEISAEKKRGMWSGKMRVPQHLSLPPTAGYLNISPGERRLTILSPHSPHRTPEFMSLSQQITLKARRKKATILPRLVLPRSDSDISEAFSEQGLEDLAQHGSLESKFGRRFLSIKSATPKTNLALDRKRRSRRSIIVGH